MTETQRTNLQRIAAAAVECERVTGCPAEISAAQCILESGWLAKAPGNNCFGIKSAPRHARTQVLMTEEVIRPEQMGPDDRVVKQMAGGRLLISGPRRFAAFETLAECFADHAALLTTGAPYRKAWVQYQADHDLAELVRAIAPIYATGTAYAAALERLIAMPAVQKALNGARQSA